MFGRGTFLASLETRMVARKTTRVVVVGNIIFTYFLGGGRGWEMRVVNECDEEGEVVVNCVGR